MPHKFVFILDTEIKNFIVSIQVAGIILNDLEFTWDRKTKKQILKMHIFKWRPLTPTENTEYF